MTERLRPIAPWLALAGLTGVGLCLRVSGLSGFALNPDEALIANLGLEGSFGDVWRSSRVEPHPPLFYLLVHALGGLGRDPGVLRLLAILPGVALIPLLFLLGRRVGGDGTGFVAAWLATFGHAPLLLSGVVRPYALLACFLAVGLACFLRILQQPGRRLVAGFSFAFTAALLTHYSAMIPFAAIGLFALRGGLRRMAPAERRRLLLSAFLPALTGLGMLVRAGSLWSGPFHRFLSDGWLRPYLPGSAAEAVGSLAGVPSFHFHHSVAAAMGVLILLGTVLLWRRGARPFVELAGWSVGLSLLLGLLGIYPLGAIRHSFHLLPFTAVLAGAAIAIPWAGLWRLRGLRRVPVGGAATAIAAVVLTSTAAVLVARDDFLRDVGDQGPMEYPVPAASLQEMSRFLATREGDGDLFLVNRQTFEVVRFYGDASRSFAEIGFLGAAYRDDRVRVTQDLFFESEDSIMVALRSVAPSADGALDEGRMWMLNVGWRSIDDAFPLGGAHRRLLTDGLALPGAYAAALPLQAFARDGVSGLPRFQVRVSRSGIHRVRYEDIPRLWNRTGGLPTASLELTHRGEGVPVWVEDGGDGDLGPGDWIEFAGSFPEGRRGDFSDYTNHNVYRLAFEGPGGLRYRVPYSAEPCTEARAPQHRRIHLEEDRTRVRFASQAVGDGEVWFWERLTPLDPEPFSLELPLGDRLADNPVTMRLHLRGWSRPRNRGGEATPDHRLELFLDGSPLPPVEWDNRKDGLVHEVRIPAGALTEGPARLELRVPSRTGEDGRPLVDVVLMNWVELEYRRREIAPEGPIRLEPLGGGCLAFEGADPDVPLRLYDEGGTRVEVDGTGIAPAAWKPQGRIELVPEGGWIPPAEVVWDRPSSWRERTHGADLVILAHERLRFALQPLVDFHRGEGLRVVVVDVQDIYDEFHHGIVHPRAIRDFLEHAHRTWEAPAPRYVLLAGDASWDPRDRDEVSDQDYDDVAFRPGMAYDRERAGGFWYQWRNEENHRNLIPTWSHPTYDGPAASDHGFIDFGPGGAPAMAIGRFPVTEPEELAAVVAKTIAYASAKEPGEWRRRILWITNEWESFKRRSDKIAASLEGFQAVTHYPTPDEPREDNRERLREELDRGQLLVHFLGHGGRFIWQTGIPDMEQDRDMFRLQDLEGLRPQTSLPVVLSMTCYSAPFDHPTADSIGEKFLRVADRGAVAVVAASWRISPTEEMSRLLVEEFTRPVTIGEAFLRAKLRSRDEEFLSQFNLLGDPAIRLAVPDGPVQVGGF